MYPSGPRTRLERENGELRIQALALPPFISELILQHGIDPTPEVTFDRIDVIYHFDPCPFDGVLGVRPISVPVSDRPFLQVGFTYIWVIWIVVVVSVDQDCPRFFNRDDGAGEEFLPR